MENDRKEQLNTIKDLLIELRVLMEMSINEGDSLTVSL